MAEPAKTLMKSRRRIAALKAQDYADFQSGITAGICDGRNGVQRSFCAAKVLSRQCPLWVISGHFGKSDRCALYPQKRTSWSGIAMSALCQKRTYAVQQFAIYWSRY